MERLIIFCIFSFFVAHKSIAQYDTDTTRNIFIYKEGVYLDYLQFRENKPIPKEKIVSDIDTSQLDFFTKIISKKSIQFYDVNGQVQQVEPSAVWGYYQNEILFINYKNTFYKVPVIGSICYFIGTEEVTYYSSYGMGMSMGYPYGMNVPMKVKETREFLMDYYTGNIYLFSIEQLEEMLKADPALYTEFSNLSKRLKKKRYSYYIRLFNEKHSIKH